MSASLLELLLVGVAAGLIIGLFPGGRTSSRFRNILIGIIGAILGSFIYKQFLTGVLRLGLPTLELNLNQLVIALLGAVLFLFLLSVIDRGK